MTVNEAIKGLILAGALFVVNSSGGKDSQAMTIALQKIIPARQLIIIHAHLPGVEWDGVKEHIEATALGIPVHYCQAVKTFFEMVEHRGKFPSPKYRQCTSDLKRGPIEKFIRAYMKAHGFTMVVNCMGMRAQESSARAKKSVFEYNEGNSKSGRTWFDWLPIHDKTTDEVFADIANAGQKPHWAYAAGMTRLSCVFCIMASEHDIKTAARLNPTMKQLYSDTEKRLGFSLMSGSGGKQVFLDDIINRGRDAEFEKELAAANTPVALYNLVNKYPDKCIE